MQTILPHAHRSKPGVSIPPGIAHPISSPLRTLFQKFSADPITPRPHQTALAEQVTQILARADYAYLEAPTGTGKTLVMAMIANQSDMRYAYYLAHTKDLIAQAQADIDYFVSCGLLSPDIEWQFMTWRKYASQARRGEIDPSNGDHLVFVDECHMGGSGKADQQVICFPVIRKTSTAVVWISATPWDLDHSIMGPRADHTAYFSFEDAYKAQLINPTNLVRIDCGLALTLARTPDASPAAFYRAEHQALSIAGETAEQTFSDLDKHVKDILDRGLRTRDVPLLVAYRYRLMADLYAHTHRGEKAIFWLPTKQHARQCADYLNQLLGSDHSAIAVLGANGTYDPDQRLLASWLDPRGHTKIACVVYRLREGFDYPHLALGFDCAWNPYNYKNAIQKIGRLTRKSVGKALSTYYYAVDAISIAAANNRQFSKHFTESLSASYATQDMTIAAHALADAQGIRTALAGGSSTAPHPEIARRSISGYDLTATTLPLFEVINAQGSAERARIDITDLFAKSFRSQADQYVAEIERGEREMPKLYIYDDPIANAIRTVVSQSSNGYRPDLRQRLIACGALVPSRGYNSQAKEKLERIVSDIEKHPANWSKKHPDYKWVCKYFNPHQSVYRPDIRQRLIACGALKPREKLADRERRCAETLMARIESGHVRWSTAHTDYHWFHQIYSPNHDTYDPAIRERMFACGALVPRGQNLKKTRDPELLLAAIESGEIEWSSKHKDYHWFKTRYRPGHPDFDPAIRKRMIACGALTTRREKPPINDKQLERLVRQIEQGKATYSATDPSQKQLRYRVGPSTNGYNAELRNRLIACGALRPKGHAKSRTPATETE